MPCSSFSVEDNLHLYHACERILVETDSCKPWRYFKFSTAVDSIRSRAITAIPKWLHHCPCGAGDKSNVVKVAADKARVFESSWRKRKYFFFTNGRLLLRKWRQQTGHNFINRCKRLNYCRQTAPCITEHVRYGWWISLPHCYIWQSDNHHVSTISCQLSKANDTGLGLELTVLPWRANHPFMIG